jgi:hypothetical protein
VGSVFVCPSREGFCNGRWRSHVYEVEIKGAKKVFWANAEMWTEAAFRPEDAESYANSYWRIPTTPSSRHFFKEVLVYGGTVTVVREVGGKARVSSVRKARAVWAEVHRKGARLSGE